MGRKRLVIALGLVALLLMVGIAGCSSVESEPPGNDQSANPLEDITNPDNPEEKQSMKVVGWPEGPPAASGTIEKLTGNTFDLREMVPIGEAEAKVWQVVFSSDTRVFRPKFIVGEPEGKDTQPKELSVHDLEEGQRVAVWGEVNGNRIFADTISFMSGAMVK
ncbi:hypothetical protein ES703_38010 [subsurface metagenome]